MFSWEDSRLYKGKKAETWAKCYLLLGSLLSHVRRGTKFIFGYSQGQSWGKWVETVDRFQLQVEDTFLAFGVAAIKPDAY